MAINMPDVIEVFAAINELAELTHCKKVEYGDRAETDHYLVTFTFKIVNAEYTDCLVLYVADDSFDKEDMLEEIRRIRENFDKLVG